MTLGYPRPTQNWYGLIEWRTKTNNKVSHPIMSTATFNSMAIDLTDEPMRKL